jgi:hypothetical protein
MYTLTFRFNGEKHEITPEEELYLKCGKSTLREVSTADFLN